MDAIVFMTVCALAGFGLGHMLAWAVNGGK